MQVWYGKNAAMWVIVSYLGLMLAYFSSRFVPEIVFYPFVSK
jgi:ABC-type uncharacterized transport system permease subunit